METEEGLFYPMRLPTTIKLSRCSTKLSGWKPGELEVQNSISKYIVTNRVYVEFRKYLHPDDVYSYVGDGTDLGTQFIFIVM